MFYKNRSFMPINTETLRYEAVRNFIDGRFQEETLEVLEVHSPLDGRLLTTVPLSTEKTLDMAVQAAKNALAAWSAATVKERVQIFYTYRNLLLENLDRLSELICEENGKTFAEAKAELEKSVELTEFACSMPQMVGEEVLEVSRGVECRIERRPVGVVASIAPFNFPSMVPLQARSQRAPAEAEREASETGQRRCRRRKVRANLGYGCNSDVMPA